MNPIEKFFKTIWYSLVDWWEEIGGGKRSKARVKVKRHKDNPLLSPRKDKSWESEGVFNPAVVKAGDEVHTMYRAVGSNGASSFGYAKSKDGFDFHERSNAPAYSARKWFEGVHEEPRGFSPAYGSGGGWGGCEDPKLTCIDDKVYLTYVAHPGYWPPRTAISSIPLVDFLKNKWQKWSEPHLMSPPNADSKSAILLSEKIDGKYVIFHRVWPDVIIDYVSDLDFSSDDKWLKPTARIKARSHEWDNHKISLAASPVKTDEGWLAIYSAVDKNDFSKYKMGAMLLDSNDPSKVLKRTKAPMMEPDMDYENDWKPGIIYPSGNVVMDGNLHIYYGGGDKYVCLATSPLDRFLWELKHELDITPPSMSRVMA